MTDKEKIRAEVERLRKSYQIMYQELDCESPKLMSVCAKKKLGQDILMFIDSLQEEPVSEDLEEAAKNHAAERYRTTRDRELAEKCKWSFKAGAEWQKEQFEKDYTNLCNGIVTVKGLAVAMTYNKGVADTKEQMMAKAIETTFNVSLPSGLYDKLWIKGCKEGDKLLVIKKDEL